MRLSCTFVAAVAAFSAGCHAFQPISISSTRHTTVVQSTIRSEWTMMPDEPEPEVCGVPRGVTCRCCRRSIFQGSLKRSIRQRYLFDGCSGSFVLLRVEFHTSRCGKKKRMVNFVAFLPLPNLTLSTVSSATNRRLTLGVKIQTNNRHLLPFECL